MAIDISKKQKEKIYQELDAALYREFNQGLDDLRATLDIDEQGLLDGALESAFEDGGAKELRNFIDDIMKILFKAREEMNNPKPPNNVKPVRFNKPYRPVVMKTKKENINQLKMEF